MTTVYRNGKFYVIDANGRDVPEFPAFDTMDAAIAAMGDEYSPLLADDLYGV